MTDDFWLRVRAAFDAAVDAPPDDRDRVLLLASGGDDSVHREALALLAGEGESFLNPGEFAIDTALLQSTILPGAEVGGYRVVGLVGRGGMGEVYEGVRSLPGVERRVAIKVLRAGSHGTDAVRRFERERKILGGLEHRNIASLLDGGVLPSGLPYLVMEFVEGERITDWAAARRLSIADRLTLFRQICGAVSHAHRNLIVHRDLKPANIFVTADGTVKLLDFGIAKVLDDETHPGDASTLTQHGGTALTPEYAAPEQLTGGSVTTATDVYALGLLLFEMLTGNRPFARDAASLPEMARLVLTTDPPIASTMVSLSREGLDAPRARRQLRGDLDAILVKCLRTASADRYGAVDELADDLRRHERGMPVDAMRGHRGYRLAKFARRNRGALLAAAVVAVAVATGLVSTWRESRRTIIQRARAETANRFLTDMLSSVDPAAAGREVAMVTVLDSAATRIAGDTTLDPEVEASLRAAIGVSYRSLGKYAAALPHLERVVALRERNPGDPLARARALRDLALLHDSRGEYGSADSLFRRALAALPPTRDSSTTDMMTDLLGQRARMQSLNGDLPAAAATLEEMVARLRVQDGDRSPQVATALSQLGVTYSQQGALVAAETTQRVALDIRRALYRPPHPEIGRTLGRLATALDQEGKRDAADSAYRESLSMLGTTLGTDHGDVAWIRYNYAGFLLDNHDWNRAINEADSVLLLRGATIPEGHPTIAGSIQTRALALSGRGDHDAAARGLREALALRRRYLPATHWLIGSTESLLGEELLSHGSRPDAMRLMTDGCRIIIKVLGPEHPTTRKALDRLTRAGIPGAACR